MTTIAIVLFTRDLRVHDNPTVRAAAESADRVLPVFVLDEGVLDSAFLSPNRATFLVDALHDLDEALKARGSHGLVLRRGDPVAEVAALVAETGATQVHLSTDWSRHAQRRQHRLGKALADTGAELVIHDDTIAVVPPGAVAPSDKDHFSVFTPFHRRWLEQPRRQVLDAPGRLPSPAVRKGRIPAAKSLCSGDRAKHLPEGGETAGRSRMHGWLRASVPGYEAHHDDLYGDRTTRLSPYLHFGCVSPTELVAKAGRSRGGDALVRQVSWRDFNLQLLAARPEVAVEDYRGHGDRWRDDEDAFAAWREGRTGYPIVDAAMRQLVTEGWMHNRGRLITASFLTKTLYVDWREGARYFAHHLVDGDVANNQLNWQWVAGTGTDTRPNRVLNPLRQAERFDPHGAYVRRYVPELAGVQGPEVHQPWKLPAEVRAELDYPEPIVDLAEGRLRFLEARQDGSR